MYFWVEGIPQANSESRKFLQYLRSSRKVRVDRAKCTGYREKTKVVEEVKKKKKGLDECQTINGLLANNLNVFYL